MDDLELRTTVAAQDAAAVLIALGWQVAPPTSFETRWLVGDELLTTTELLAIASFAVIFPRAKRQRR
ncbi:MAG: hypothetical protein INR62_09350 [Rhodospirillales bacterium]|nr:hypothetical protein [Acetobacter sp.]